MRTQSGTCDEFQQEKFIQRDIQNKTLNKLRDSLPNRLMQVIQNKRRY